MMAVLKKSDGTVVASDVEMADTLLKQAIGLMFRRQAPPGYAMIFDLRQGTIYQYSHGIRLLFD